MVILYWPTYSYVRGAIYGTNECAHQEPEPNENLSNGAQVMAS